MVIEEPDKKQDFDEADDALLEPFKRVDGIFQNIAWREMKIDEKIYIAKEFMSRRDASGGKFKIDLFPSRYGWDTRTFEKLVADVGSEMKLNIALPYPFEPIGVGEDGYVRYRILRRGDRVILSERDSWPSICRPLKCRPSICRPLTCRSSKCRPSICRPLICSAYILMAYILMAYILMSHRVEHIGLVTLTRQFFHYCTPL